MQATNGFAVPFRRLSGCVFALALVISALFASSAGAVTATHSDLALGDSLAFGYSQQLFNENFPTESPTAFEHGYANYYFNGSKAKAAGSQLINNGCPGETTDSMIGNGPLGGALDPTEGESPCGYHKLGFPLHHEYGGTKSQLENAIEVLTVGTLTSKPVTTVTLNIGANDELHGIAKCEAEVKAEYEAEGKSKYGATPEAAVKGCIEAHVNALFGHILHNIGSITYAIRNYGVFAAAATGNPALAGLKYTGKLVFEGAYDPYGNVFGTGELLVGSRTLASILDFHEKKLMTDEGTEAAEEGHEAFKACFAEALATFNPGTAKEPIHLQAWTNMANTTESNGKKNGPDIHPTPLGYHEIGGVLNIKQCGVVE
ncbi:MAG TPA: hypothetical protein VNZ01_01125 [Solirubrobacteraceae bacterium]|jgi:hypothetical protein|nr:hypothetical protein [Solirubrobacteraceae bacterium]